MKERRICLRIPVTFRATFSGLDGTGQGTIVDLGSAGCRIESRTSVLANTYLELRLHLSPEATPLVVDLAAVRWAREGQLGIEFLDIRTEDQAKLVQLVDQAQS